MRWHHHLNRPEFQPILGDGELEPGVLQSMELQRVEQD